MADTPPETAATKRADDAALDLIFREARTYYAWKLLPVSDELLHEIYAIAFFGPTGANMEPLRILGIVKE